MVNSLLPPNRLPGVNLPAYFLFPAHRSLRIEPRRILWSDPMSRLLRWLVLSLVLLYPSSARANVLQGDIYNFTLPMRYTADDQGIWGPDGRLGVTAAQ